MQIGSRIRFRSQNLPQFFEGNELRGIVVRILSAGDPPGWEKALLIVEVINPVDPCLVLIPEDSVIEIASGDQP